ncbi:MAG: hypothetical protein H6832_14680 [Planctomycetes bacterium]|nr:hypothetical protein [Planctomycetota bacterium]
MTGDDFGFLDDLEESAMLGDLLGMEPSSNARPSQARPTTKPSTRTRSSFGTVRTASTILKPLERTSIGDVLSSISWSGSAPTLTSDKHDEHGRHAVSHGSDDADDSDELGENYLHTISW